MTSTRWLDFDSTPRHGDVTAPPPHASACYQHGTPRYFRDLAGCPWCRDPKLEDNGLYHTPVYRPKAPRKPRSKFHQPLPHHVAKWKASLVLRAKGIPELHIARMIGVKLSTLSGWPREASRDD
jgi:hypothetical protein